MEAHWAAHFLTHPVPVLLGLGFVVVITLGLSPAHAIPPILARRQLFLGYLGIFISCILASAWISYVPPEEALTVWKIPPENYWPSLRDEFLAQLVLLSFVSLIGSAIVGVPIVIALSRRGLATVPSVLILSVAVSLLTAMIFVLLGVPGPDVQFVQIAPPISGLHLFLSLGFSIGARLQWRLRQRT